MNVNFAGQHSLFNVSRVNQSISNKTGNTPQRTNGMQSIGRDTVSISSRGKAMSLIDNLMKQKEQIYDRKSELIGNTLEKGDDIGSIESQLESFEEQLTNIDEQITNAMATEMEKGKNEPKSYKKTEAKTKEEVVNNRLADIVNVSIEIKQMEATYAVKKKIDGETNVLKSQVKTDQGATKDSKLEQISKMENMSSKIANQIGEELNHANKIIDKSSHIDKDLTNKDTVIVSDTSQNPQLEILNIIPEKEL